MPLTCYDMSQYGALLIIDPKDEFFAEEVTLIQSHVTSLVVVADWYNIQMMDKIQFYDSSTFIQWYPITGGANVPALKTSC